VTQASQELSPHPLTLRERVRSYLPDIVSGAKYGIITTFAVYPE
jgi:hypothetical protein